VVVVVVNVIGADEETARIPVPRNEFCFVLKRLAATLFLLELDSKLRRSSEYFTQIR
jgi:hypothetical protein